MGGLGIALLVAALIIIVLVIAVVSWFVRGQNKLVHADELVGNSLSQIGVQQASRWDALTALADLTGKYAGQEKQTLIDIIGARKGITAGSNAAEVDAQEAALVQGMGRINALAEAYPELKSNTLYLKSMDEVTHYEDNVRMSRMVYNDSVTKYNRLVRSLPGSVLAGGLGFAPRDYLQDDPAKAEMPVLDR